MNGIKAMMEKYLLPSQEPIQLNFGTRYGNVMASRGSVIPHFYDQIKSGNDITVIDPNMTRFMMTFDDAVNLVLYENGNSGDIFVQKSPTVGEARTMKNI